MLHACTAGRHAGITHKCQNATCLALFLANTAISRFVAQTTLGFAFVIVVVVISVFLFLVVFVTQDSTIAIGVLRRCRFPLVKDKIVPPPNASIWKCLHVSLNATLQLMDSFQLISHDFFQTGGCPFTSDACSSRLQWCLCMHSPQSVHQNTPMMKTHPQHNTS